MIAWRPFANIYNQKKTLHNDTEDYCENTNHEYLFWVHIPDKSGWKVVIKRAAGSCK